MPKPIISGVSQSWIRAALRNEGLFSDGPPQWDKLPSQAQAREEQTARARLFRKFGARRLARKLSECEIGSPCASGACPVCNRALQRHFVSEAFTILQPPAEFVTISLIPNVSIRLGDLAQLPITDFTDLIENKLTKSKVRFCIGGIDFTYNEHRGNDFRPHWAPHIWILTHKRNRHRWETLLRRYFSRTRTVFRPIKIQDWDGDRAAIGYALKYQFGRRISDLGLRSSGERVCKVTSYDRLRSRERFELYSYLHEIGLGARILLMGIESTPPPLLRLD
jgi:hypothetical protein